MSDAYEGLDAARRAGWARAYDAEEVAAHMLFSLYLSGVLADDWRDAEDRAGQLVKDWLNAGDPRPGWVSGATEPPPLTRGQVESRIRIAQRFLELDGRTAQTWDEPREPRG